MRFILSLFLISSFSVLAADVQVITDVAKGQGFLYEHNSKCYVVTPSHVIEEASEISALTASRKSYDAKLVKNFDIDLALLELKNAKKLCKSATFIQSTKLSSLLKIYEEGVLKSKLADGSTLQTKVNIVGVDETEMLQIKPKKNKDILKQGYSGSVLFIANQPSGILLEVDDGSGYVYRSDALNKRLEKYFYPNGKPKELQKITPTIDKVLEGEIAKGKVLEFEFVGEINSPVEFAQIPSGERADFKLEILNAKNKVLFKDNYNSAYKRKFAFTPKKTGKYLVRITGIKKHGLFTFKTQQWGIDSEFRGEGNILEAGDEIANRIAKNAIIEYQFYGEANSPVEFAQIPSDERADFKLEILNAKNKVLFKDNYSSTYERKFAFTPKKTGKYLVRITGKKNHGLFAFKTQQWGIDSEFRGEGNILEAGDEITNRIAKNAIIEYQFYGEANSPVEFAQIPSDERADFKLEILNAKNKVLFKDNYSSTYERKFAFTPKKTGKYLVRITGKKNHGEFGFLVTYEVSDEI